MKFSAAIGLVLLIISSCAFSQNFDGQNGYIFDQDYVTRITESDASALLKIRSAGDVFWNLYTKNDKTLALPKSVKKSADKLIFEAEEIPSLSLKNYIYKGKDDSGDSQIFLYVREFAKYHLVAVEFDHDRPCFMLIDKDTLKVYFINYDAP